MGLRRERVVLADDWVEQYANHYERMRHVVSSMGRNDRARRESQLYAADPKLPGPQVWEGDDS